jgi:hypothetical protein
VSRLSGYVLAEDPKKERVLLSPYAPLPSWATPKTIPNPKAWAPASEPSQGPDTSSESA